MERYVISGGKVGFDRLEILAAIHRDDTVDLLRRVGVPSGARCLDLGCGGGAVTFELAAMAGPEGTVIGIDMDDELLVLSADAARERGITNVEFRSGSVMQWDEPQTYDIVYARLLLQHLSEPLVLLRRMWDAVRPGGALVVEDADFDAMFCEPPNAGFDFYLRNYRRVLELNGGDPTIGRKLYRYFLELGIPHPQVHLIQTVQVDTGERSLPLYSLPASAAAIRAAGLASDEEIEAAMADLTSFVHRPGAMFGDPRFGQVFARRPS